MSGSECQYKLYKTKAAMRLSYIGPQTKRPDDQYLKPGVIFLEAASAKDDETYDWANKIIVALSATDIGSMLAGLKGVRRNIFHDKFKGSAQEGREEKIINFEPSDDKQKIFVKIAERKNGELRKLPVIALDIGERICISELLKCAAPKIHGW